MRTTPRRRRATNGAQAADREKWKEITAETVQQYMNWSHPCKGSDEEEHMLHSDALSGQIKTFKHLPSYIKQYKIFHLLFDFNWF